MLKKKAKILTKEQQQFAWEYLTSVPYAVYKRYPRRDRVIFLLSVLCGLRAKEIANVTWGMVFDSSGNIGDSLNLEDWASKGSSGRDVPIHPLLKEALQHLGKGKPSEYIIFSDRNKKPLTPRGVAHWFKTFYNELGFYGCTSHSGRRTFIDTGAREVVKAGGSIKEVQELVGHASLETTQGYVDGNQEVKKRLISMLWE